MKKRKKTKPTNRMLLQIIQFQERHIRQLADEVIRLTPRENSYQAHFSQKYGTPGCSCD